MTDHNDFMRELADLAVELRSQVEANSIGLDPSPAARAQRRYRVLVEGDFEFFA